MAQLQVLVVLLVWECVAAKYVLPNPPFFNNPGTPQREFSERDILPFDNLDKRVSEQTTMAELKRMFEALDQTSVPSDHVRDDDDDESHGPIAWYKPQQDESLYDTGECVDKFSICHRYVDNGECWKTSFKAWMGKKCAKSCGFCDCWNSKYGCCPDDKTPADGPHKAGCGVKLCIDLRDCEKVKDECDSVSLAPERKAWLKTNCAFTCRMCKAPSPIRVCESHHTPYGCCWNGDEATGWNNQGCLPCEDTYVRACKLFAACPSPFFNARIFEDHHCPKSCGRCGECVDKKETSKCEQWEIQGLCKSRSTGWRDYMAENCAKTCRLCQSSENVHGVRSFLGL